MPSVRVYRGVFVAGAAGAILARAAWGYVIWLALASIFLAFPPAGGTAWLVAWTGLFTWRHLSHRSGTAYTGTGSPPPGAAWLVKTTGVLLIFDVAFVPLYGRVLPMPAHEHGPLEEYALRPWGALPYALFVGLAAPMLEEVTFRGWIQGRMSRAFGPAVAIATSSLLFAVLHGKAVLVGYYLVWGLLLGYAVHATGSLWTGVVLHGVPNFVLAAQHLGHLEAVPIYVPVHDPVVLLLCLVTAAGSGVVLVRLLRTEPPTISARS